MDNGQLNTIPCGVYFKYEPVAHLLVWSNRDAYGKEFDLKHSI
jgi:hypothetical protein